MSTSSAIQILTPSGYQDFIGIKKSVVGCLLIFTFEDQSSIGCTPDHRFIINGNEIFAKDLCIGNSIGKHIINNIQIKNECIDVYDPSNVENGSHYIHDDLIVSHNCAIGSSSTLVSADALLGLIASPPTRYLGGLSGTGSIKIYEEPQAGHRYFMMVDVSKGRGQDYSTFNLLDATVRPFKQVAVYRNNMISPLLLPDILVGTARRYNDALIVIENNDAGQVVCNGVYYDLEYENTFVESAVKTGGVGVTMTKRVKRIGCSNLKDLIESGKLIVSDPDTIIELSTFEASGDSFAAAEGCHDDLVMNLVLFAWFLSTPFAELSDGEFKSMLFAEKIRMMEEELCPPIITGPDAGFEKPQSSYEVERLIEQHKRWISL